MSDTHVEIQDQPSYQQRQSIVQWVLLYIKGMAMGAADVVPGVSGGTVALMTGIYEELIDSLRNTSVKALLILRKEGLLAAWNSFNGSFLTVLFAGVLTSIALFAGLITHLLETEPVLVWSFFFGLIVVSACFVMRQRQAWSVSGVIALGVGVVVAYMITELSPAQAPDASWMVFLAGCIAICAMILPGISGSFILLLMGMYAPIMGAIKGFEVVTLTVFALGCLCGLLSVSRVLSWLFHHYRDVTLAVLAGFMLGSLNKVWPWQVTTVYRTNSKGEEVPFLKENVLPEQFLAQTGQAPETFWACTAAVAAVVLVLVLEWWAIKVQQK